MGESDIEPCAIARSLGVLGERWTFLIVREALWGATRFGEFRDALGVAPDVLTARLARLVDAGVMEKVPYQEPGSRQRWAYELTPAGRDLQVVLGAMQGWGDRHIPRPEGPSVERRTVDGGPAGARGLRRRRGARGGAVGGGGHPARGGARA